MRLGDKHVNTDAARIGRRLARAVAISTALLALVAGSAQACSKDDNNYLDSFLDVTCVESLSNTTLDARGGLRLVTNGTASSTTWDTDFEFDSGATHQTTLYAPVGVRTLSRSGTGPPATLGLPGASFPLTLAIADPVLDPAAAAVGDNDNVDDPSVVKVGATYKMFYSGSAEDSDTQSIFLATSADGKVWTRANGGVAVLTGTVAAFDAHGVFAPEVLYDAANALAPYKMYYSGRGPTFGSIGYATSLDGITWTKYTGGTAAPKAVIEHGAAGSADSIAASDPSVLKDGATWKMWYTGDDSSKKRIAYATSSDGLTWSKGGKVIAPEDAGVSANIEFGAFSPSVFKTGPTSYVMLLTGRKLVSGTTFQTKIMNSSSSDGISWSGPSPALNPAGSNSSFDYSNLNGPFVLSDPGSASPYKLYYAGNTVDANGNFHTRIGLAQSSNGNSFSKFSGAQASASVFDINTLGTAFDARSVSGLSVAGVTGATSKFVGFYSGMRGIDFKSRLGEATSGDGGSWLKVAGASTGGALLGLGNTAAFDNGGQADPAVLYDASTYYLYFTATDASGVSSIGVSSTAENGITKLPENASWSDPSAAHLAKTGSGFEAAGVSHPSVIAAAGGYVMYYTATNGSGVTSIGRATAATADGVLGGRAQVLQGTASTYDKDGVKDPVVALAAPGDFRMIYTAVETLGGVNIERLAYATSADGITWSKAGLALNPSQTPYAADERGVRASGMVLDGANWLVWGSGVSRAGRTSGMHATAPLTPPGGSKLANGWATYQLGDSTKTVRDFRQVARTSSGPVTIWMSFLQPYSTAGSEYWSDYFPVTAASATEALNFLLTVRGVRWQVRMVTPGSAPSLNSLAISHAPVSFASTGSALTMSIAPPPGQVAANWNTVKVNASIFQPGGGGSAAGTIRVLSAASGQQLASSALSTSGDTTVNVSAFSAVTHPALKVAVDMTSADGQASPLVNSLQVVYNAAIPPPPPPPPPVATLATSASEITFGESVTLSGTLTQSAVPIASATVSLLGQPFGGVFAAVAAPLTDAAGAFSASAAPDKFTTYNASYAGLAAEPSVTVAVRHNVTMSARRKGTTGYLKGLVKPLQPGSVVVIEQLKKRTWSKIAAVKTSSTSKFSRTVRKLSPKGKYQYRARVLADTDNLEGLSAVAYIEKMRVSLGIKLSKRTALFAGKVSPAHKGKTVIIRSLVGGVWKKLGSAKLSSTSTYKLKEKLAKGAYSFKTTIVADKDHFGGESVVRKLTVK